MNLEVKARKEGVPLPSIDVEGEIDVYTSPLLKEKVVSLLEEKIYNFVINLEKVTYIDSTGLGILIGALRRCREQKGEVYLIYSNPRLIRIFEITGLNNNFKIFPSYEEFTKVYEKSNRGQEKEGD